MQASSAWSREDGNACLAHHPLLQAPASGAVGMCNVLLGFEVAVDGHNRAGCGISIAVGVGVRVASGAQALVQARGAAA